MIEAPTNTHNAPVAFPEKARQFFLRSVRNLIHGRGSHQEQREAVHALDAHIKQGLALIHEGRSSEATRIFTSYDTSALLGIGLDIINYTLNRLLTPDDVARASRNAANESWHYSGGNVRLVIGTPNPPIIIEGNGIRSTTFSEFPDRYTPAAVDTFQQELAILQAEALAHELRDRLGGPIAGQKDHDADVAAYIYQQGVPLSTEYITRYQSRIDWYSQVHPERRAELQAFSEVWGGI